MSTQPVFFDPDGKRRKRVGFWAASLGLLLAILTTAFIVSLFVVPLLPSVKGLSDSRHRPNHLIPHLPDANKRQALFLANKARQELNEEVSKDKKRIELEKANARKSPQGSPIVAAFYAPWQEVGITSFRQNAKHLTHVMPAWLRIDKSDPGKLDTTDFDPKVNSHNPELIEIARRNGVRIWPVLSNFTDDKGDVFDGKLVHALLDDPEKQTTLIRSIRDWLEANAFEGLNLDFENLSRTDLNRLPQFLKALREELKAGNLGLSIDLEVGSPGTELEFAL